MKKILILTILCSVLSNNSFSQDLLSYAAPITASESVKSKSHARVFEFNGYSRESEIENVPIEIAGKHVFGELIAKKLYLLDHKYKYQVALVPGNPQTKSVIKKPVVYEAVKRIEKDLKKSVKNGELSTDIAASQLNKVLDVALNILTADTREFEDAITSAKSITGKISLFTQQVKLNY
jgi:hypothetical protein